MKKVVYFDQIEARRLLLELSFKGAENLSFYAYKDFKEDFYRLNDLKPDLVILDQDYDGELPPNCWILGKDIPLPFNPIDLKAKVLSFLA